MGTSEILQCTESGVEGILSLRDASGQIGSINSTRGRVSLCTVIFGDRPVDNIGAIDAQLAEHGLTLSEESRPQVEKLF